MSTFLLLLDDLKRRIALSLEPYDILSLSLTSKEFYQALRKIPSLREKVCYPFKSHNSKTFKLTLEQCQTLQNMMNANCALKMCQGPSGHGKTWLMIAYAFYRSLRFTDRNDCVVFILPPTKIAAFSLFWRDNIQYPALSNYVGSWYHHDDWRSIIDKHRV